MENSSYQKVLDLALAIKSFVIEKITTHEGKTSSTQQKGHSYAGGAPQPIGQNIQAGTDNGYYARADHVHTVDFANIQNTPNALNVVDDLNTDDGSSPLSAKQGKWLNENKENVSNKTTSITNSSTDTQYPSAKAVYDLDVGVKNDFHSFANNSNVNCYIKFLRIVYSGSYSDSVISFTLYQRSQPPTNISFNTEWDNNNQKYNIGKLYYDGYPRAIYVHRSAQNTFDFYINPGAWGTYSISPIKTDKNRIGSSIVVTKLSEVSDSLPTSTTDAPLLQATLNPYYSPVTHNHTKSQITDFPTTMTPTDESVTRNKLGSDIQVSGTNLLTGTQLFDSPISATPGASKINGTYYGCNVRYLKNTGSSYIDFAWSIPYEQVESNGYYTLSFWAKTTTAHDNIYTYFYSGNVNTKRIKSNTTVSGYSGNGAFGDGSTRFALSTEWKRYYVVYQLNSTAPGTGNKTLTIRLNSNTSNPPDIYLAGVKFERGTIPTEWSPHPNDWNDIPMSNGVTAPDMAMNQELNPNRLAYLPGENITVEYRLNSNSEWIDYEASAADKSRLVTSSYSFKSGKDETANANHQLRIAINAGGGNNTASNVYLFTRKLMIHLATGANSANVRVQVETSTYDNPTTWSSIGIYHVAGNSGWNSIPLAITFGGAASQTTGERIQNIRLTFTTDSAYKFTVSRIRLYGENCWLNPSNLANNGHMYSYDIDKNVTFPAKIIKSGGTSSQFLKADGAVDSNAYIHTAGTNLSKSNNTLNHATSGVGAKSSGLYKTTIDAQGHITNATSVAKADITSLGIPAQDTTYTPASETPLTENYMGAVGTEVKYAREDHRHPTFDYIDSGTSGQTGYVEAIQIKINGSYQDVPIKIEIFQRQSTQNSILFIRFNSNSNTDPGIGSFYHSGSNNSGFWLYKKSAGTYSLIVKKAGTEAYDTIRLKVTNPNAAIAISNINSQLANLPSDTATNPLQSTYIGPESTATNIKMNGTQSAGSLNTYARADHVHPVDTSRATSGHGHGNITNSGAIGSTANLPVITGTSGKLQAGSFGTTANTFCQGNDSRLSDSRVPVFTHIPASSSNTQDLNSSTYKVGGFYYCGHDGNEAPYISNCPLSGSSNKSFFLLVETWGPSSTNYVKQTLTYYNTNKTYTRTCSGGTWGTWTEFAAANHTHSYISTAGGSVGTSNLANNAVTSAKIADGTIVNGDIANTTITGGKLVDGTITATQLQNNAVETAKIKDANVTTAKIADNAITNAKIADGTITNTDISASAAIAYSKLSGVAAASHTHSYAATSHNHSTWTEKQTHANGDKVIYLYVNEQLKMCDLYWQNVTALNANTNHTVASSGWINATYRPHQPVVGGGAYTGTTTVGTGGDIVYRIPVTITSNTVYGHAMWHY